MSTTTPPVTMPVAMPATAPSPAAVVPRKVDAVRIIGVPMDLGASRRGVDMGPSALRLAGLADRLAQLGYTVEDCGNVRVPDRTTLGPAGEGGTGRDFLPSIALVCEELAALTATTVRLGAVPLVLGGDHSLGAGSVAGVATALGERGQRLGLIWLDAHGDLHTPETSHSGNVHGMPVAHLLGSGDPRLSHVSSVYPAVRAENLAFVGLRDLDPPEKAFIRQAGIAAFTMRDIDERGLRAVMSDAIEIASRGTGGIHVSCDADWVDPAEAPGVGTPVRGGATMREAHLAMEMISDTGALVGMDLVEINPILDRHNHTAELAVDLLASAFGRGIL
ncbi:arginase [Gemmatirosa kalamazoonensis]|uniref:Arginase n=1 Tax=Gemmatirosa kalamazoonensis TaxID=861299 RepID=W0RDL8_9BACT|nr:arginase [Gemmatirosa kalamazoonensis]AHG88537.1 arginase [Gemmatirosa kalamazoonensis]